MKSASTPERTVELIDNYNAGRTKPIATFEYFDGAQWIPLNDIEGFSFSRSSKNKDVARFSLAPTPQELSASLNNRRSLYSPDTTGEFSNVLQRNVKVRASIGYEFPSAIPTVVDFNYSVASYEEAYHTQAISSKIYNAIASAVASEYNGLPFTFYDEMNYDEGTYSAEGYYKSNILDFGVYDVEILKKFIITSDTTKIKVYYRVASARDTLENGLTPFIFLGDTINGTANLDLPAGLEEYRYFQFALVFITGDWYSGVDENYATSIKIRYETSVEYFPSGEFLIDTVSFSSSEASKLVSIGARDRLKKALETNASTADYTTQNVSKIIRDIADKVSIPHNDGVTEYIPDSAYSVSIEGYKDKKVIDIFEEAMQYLNAKDSNYRMFVNDAGYLQLTNEEQTNLNYDFIFNHIEHIFSISRSMTTDNILQRLTIFSSDEKTGTGKNVILATATYTTTGTKVLSWSGTHLKKTYDFTITSGSFEYVEMTNTSLTFIISGATPNVSVTVYGDPIDAGYVGFTGEAVRADYVENGEGYTQTIINRYIQSNAEAKTIAEELISRFSDDALSLEGSLSVDGMPLMEINDLVLILEQYTNTFQLFVIESIATSYQADGAQYKSTFGIKSIGETLIEIVYDRNYAINGVFDGVDDLLYDSGIFYDMDWWGDDVDPNVYHKKVRFA